MAAKLTFLQAFHLIKAVSVLLNFSQEEENMLKETLEYKVGLRPAVWHLETVVCKPSSGSGGEAGPQSCLGGVHGELFPSGTY